jgi:pSer/pThr/pTyr-binding forkhead associated (FHA) protein
MAKLRDSAGKELIVAAEHLIGRGPQCTLRLAGQYVSTQHALIRWSGRQWEILDRGSRNGTRLNEQWLVPGKPQRLGLGDTVAFGSTDELWTLVDEQEPGAMVLALDSGETLHGRNAVIGVPSSSEPKCTLFLDRDGSWAMEHVDGTLHRLADGHAFEVEGRRYLFSCPSLHTATTAAASEPQENALLEFKVSRDEEFVELSIRYAHRSVQLGSRAHNYLLLELARTRLEDVASGIPDVSCGWVDKDVLAEGLRMTPQQLDGEVFRIRKHFGQHSVPEAATIIERRPRTKQLRIGFSRIEIQRDLAAAGEHAARAGAAGDPG